MLYHIIHNVIPLFLTVYIYNSKIYIYISDSYISQKPHIADISAFKFGVVSNLYMYTCVVHMYILRYRYLGQMSSVP